MSTPDLTSTLQPILLFFGIAGIAVPLLQRARLSSVSAYLICGIVFGPWGMSAWLPDSALLQQISLHNAPLLHTLGELGIITLMFMIGLELSIDRLKELRRMIFGLGTAQIILTGFVIMVIALAFGNSLQLAIILGLAFAFSSTAIVMRSLEDRHLLNQKVGTLCFAILLMQDLAVVPVVILTNSLTGHGGASPMPAIVQALLSFALIVPAIYFLGRKLLRPLVNTVSITSNAEWLSAFFVFIVVLCATATYLSGLSIALGGFLAGILVAETEFKHEVEVMLAPVKGMLLGIFFLYIGTQIDLQEVMYRPLTLAASIGGLLILKAVILFLACLLFRVSVKKSLHVGCFLAQPGEFALMILGIVASAKIIDDHQLQFYFLVATLGMLCAPVMFFLAPRLWKLIARMVQDVPKEDAIIPTHEDMVVIAGFGRVGRLLAIALEQQRIPYIAFDNNAPKVKAARKKGFNVVVGDAKKFNFWRKLHEGNVRTAVIAIDDCGAIQHIIASLRQEWPLLPVIVRANEPSNVGMLYDFGATHVVTEPLESSLSIARHLIKDTGLDNEETDAILSQLREKHVYEF